MKVKRNKNKGNSLIILLVIISLITIIGGALTTAVAYTTNQNSRVKVEEDLLYAAESGLEVTRSRIKAGTVSLPSSGTNSFQLPDTMFKTNFKIEVIVSITKNASDYTIVSRATKNGKSRSVSGKLVTVGSNDIYKYVLCAEKVKIYATGDLDDQVTRWSVEDKPNSEVLKWYGHPSQLSKKENLKENPVSVPVFNFTEANRDLDLEVSSDKDLVQLLHDKSLISGSGVKELPEFTPTKVPTSKIKIFLINTPKKATGTTFKTNIYLKDGDPGGIKINNAIIISNGEININSKSGGANKPTLTLDRGTIFGREFNFNISSFTSYYTLIDNTRIEGYDESGKPIEVPNKEFDFLNATDVASINKSIGSHVTGGFGGVIPGGGAVGDVIDITYGN